MDKKKTGKGFLPTFIFILCLLQPCLDVLSYFLEEGGHGNALSSALRLLMLAVVLLAGFVLSEKKGYYFILAGVLAVLTAGHVFANVQTGYDAPALDLANLLRIYQLPIMTLCFITFLRRDESAKESLRKGIFLSLCLVALVEVVSALTGTNPYTYANKEVGLLGWFSNTSSQSAILATAAPIAMAWAMEKWEKKPAFAALTCVGALGLLYLFATRLAYVSLLGIGLGFFAAIFLVKKFHGMKIRAMAWTLALCTAVAILGYGVSPMVKNQSMVSVNREKKAQEIELLVAQDEEAAKAAGLAGDELKLARLRSAYETYLPGPTGRFGLKATAEHYDYSTDVAVIADMRLQRLCFCRLTMEAAHPLAAVFGVEREDLAYNGATYDAENDFHGIFYLTGTVGLVLMLAFLAVFLWRILRSLAKDFKATFTLEAVGCALALICCLAHSYFTAGVLRRPNAIFYLAAVLAMIWILTEKKKVSD